MERKHPPARFALPPVSLGAGVNPAPRCFLPTHMSPNCSLAASDIRLWSHGGSS